MKKPFWNFMTTESYDYIHQAALKILDKTGFVFHHDVALKILKKHGAKIENQTAFLPPKMVENALKTIPSEMSIMAREEKHNLTYGVGHDTIISPGSGEMNVTDIERGRRRATLADAAEIVKIAHQSPYYKLMGRNPAEPSEIPAEYKHLYITLNNFRHTTKPTVSFFSKKPWQPREILDMYAIAFGGGMEFLKQNTVTICSICPLPPLRLADDTLETIIYYAQNGQGCTVSVCGILSAQIPLDPVGSCLETLMNGMAVATLQQSISPGAIFEIMPGNAAPDMTNLNWRGSSPDSVISTAITLQMLRDFYKIPSRIMTATSDNNELNCQGGMEIMQNVLTSVAAGANILTAGAMESVATTSYEKLIFDEEVLSRVLYISKEEIDVDEKKAQHLVDIFDEVGIGGDFLTHSSTMANYRNLWRPTVSDWRTYENWEAEGKQSVLERCRDIWKKRLAQAPETQLTPDLEKDLVTYVKRAQTKR